MPALGVAQICASQMLILNTLTPLDFLEFR